MVDINIIRRLREKRVNWAIIAYAVGIKESAARMALKRDNDRLELPYPNPVNIYTFSIKGIEYESGTEPSQFSN
jgi:hypothetical protein